MWERRPELVTLAAAAADRGLGRPGSDRAGQGTGSSTRSRRASGDGADTGEQVAALAEASGMAAAEVMRSLDTAVLVGVVMA